MQKIISTGGNRYKNHCFRDDICTNESEMEKMF